MVEPMTPIEKLIIEACRYRVKQYCLAPSVIKLASSIGKRGFFHLTEYELRLSLRLLQEYESRTDIGVYVSYQCNQAQKSVNKMIDDRIGCDHPLEK